MFTTEHKIQVSHFTAMQRTSLYLHMKNIT